MCKAFSSLALNGLQRGAVALFLFVWHCAKAEHPLIDVSIFKNIPFSCHLTAFFLINAIMLGASFLLLQILGFRADAQK